VEEGVVRFNYVATAEMVADFLTKALHPPQFVYCRQRFGVAV